MGKTLKVPYILGGLAVLIVVGISSYFLGRSAPQSQKKESIQAPTAIPTSVETTQIPTSTSQISTSVKTKRYSKEIRLEAERGFLLEFDYPSDWTPEDPKYNAANSFEITLTKNNDKIRLRNYILGFGDANGVSEVFLGNVNYLRILHSGIVYNRKDSKEGGAIISQLWIDSNEDIAAQTILGSLKVTEL